MRRTTITPIAAFIDTELAKAFPGSSAIRVLELDVMPEGLWLVLLLIAFVAAYTIAKVRQYMRESDEQWRRVDKSKLREWEDDDWPQD